MYEERLIEAGPLEGLPESIIGQSLLSTKMFAEIFFPERFFRPFSPLAVEKLFPVIDNPYEKYAGIICHRGFGKTNIDSIALPARHIVAGTKKCIVMVSASSTKAVVETENLKYEIERNPWIVGTFGQLKNPDVWTKDGWEANGCYVLPRGPGQQVRGFNWRGNRPDLVIVDDLEDLEGVRSDDQRKKTFEWFMGDVMGCFDRGFGGPNFQLIVVGTILHKLALMSRILENEGGEFKEFKRVDVPLCDENFKSLNPHYMDDQGVIELYEAYKAKGEADVFAREYMNKAISTEDAAFKQEYFQYLTEEEWERSIQSQPAQIVEGKMIPAKVKEHVTYFTIVDPAKTVKLHSAQSAILTFGIARESHRWWLADLTAEKYYPDELMQEAFRQAVKWKSYGLCPEVTSLNEFIKQPWTQEIQKRRLPIKFIELKARGKKEDRVAALIPHFRNKYIYFNPAVSRPLEIQLMDFPASKLWDIMDACAYIIEISHMEQEHFYGWSDDPDVIEAEYSDLDNDPMMVWGGLSGTQLGGY